MPMIVFLQGLFQHLVYFLSLASLPCLIWTVSLGIRSWGSFRRSMSPTSLERVPKLSGNISDHSHAICLVCTVQSPWGYPLFYLGFWYTSDRMMAFYTISPSLIIPAFSGGLWSSWKDCFALLIGVLEILLPDSCFHCLVTDKGFCIIIPLSLTFFWCRIPSSCSVSRIG